jgi:hypothetical protein
MILLVTYWYVWSIAVVALGFYVSNRALKGQIRTHALVYLLAAEKLVFTTTESKLTVISVAAYAALPAPLKAMVSPVAFEIMVTELYDEAKKLVDELHADPSVPAKLDPTK